MESYYPDVEACQADLCKEICHECGPHGTFGDDVAPRNFGKSFSTRYRDYETCQFEQCHRCSQCEDFYFLQFAAEYTSVADCQAAECILDACPTCDGNPPTADCLRGDSCTLAQGSCAACSSAGTQVNLEAALTLFYQSEQACILEECTVGCDRCDNWFDLTNRDDDEPFGSMKECLTSELTLFSDYCKLVDDCQTDCSNWNSLVDPNSLPVTPFADIAGGLTAVEQCNLQRCPLTHCVESANAAAFTDPATSSAYTVADFQASQATCSSGRCSECELNWAKSFLKDYTSASECQAELCSGSCGTCATGYATAFTTQYEDAAECSLWECYKCASCFSEDRDMLTNGAYATEEECIDALCFIASSLVTDCGTNGWKVLINPRTNWFYQNEYQCNVELGLIGQCDDCVNADATLQKDQIRNAFVTSYETVEECQETECGACSKCDFDFSRMTLDSFGNTVDYADADECKDALCKHIVCPKCDGTSDTWKNAFESEVACELARCQGQNEDAVDCSAC
jgi:hypothetical protein